MKLPLSGTDAQPPNARTQTDIRMAGMVLGFVGLCLLVLPLPSKTKARTSLHRLYTPPPCSTQPGKRCVLAFIHIPKCAGTAFFNRCREVTSQGPGRTRATGETEPGPADGFTWYPQEACYTSLADGRSEICRTNSWNSPGCSSEPFGGTHCGVSETADCLDRGLAQLKPPLGPDDAKPLFVTIIRNPVERVLSEYAWWRKRCVEERAWTAGLCAAPKIRGATPEERLLAWVNTHENNAHNRMTKMLAHLPAMRAPGASQSHCATFDAVRQVEFWSGHYNLTMAEGLEDRLNADTGLLENAIRTLESRFAFVGVQEHLELSATAFARMFGFGNGTVAAAAAAAAAAGAAREVHSHKSNRGKLEVSEAAIVRIKERNRLDLLLYHAVRQRFDGAFAGIVPSD